MMGIDPEVGERLCMTLLHSLWQMPLLALIAAFSRLLLRGTREQISYLIHLSALIMGLVALPATYGLLKSGVLARGDEQVAAVEQAGANVASSFSKPGEPIGSVTINESNSLSINPDVTARSAGGLMATNVAPASDWRTKTSWLFAVYVAGVAIMLVRLIRSSLLVERLRVGSEVLSEGAAWETLRRLCKTLSMKTIPMLAHGENVIVPKVVGLLKPTILLPTSALTGLSAEELEMILAHELAHVRRYDMWANLLQRFIEAILFFNPAMWWLSRRVSTLREYCCDDQVCAEATAKGNPELRYAQALLQCVALNQPPQQAAINSLAAVRRSPSELRRRVARLFGEPIREPLRLSRGSIAVVLLGVFVLASPFVLAHDDNTEEDVATETNRPEAVEEQVRASSDRILDLGGQPASSGIVKGTVSGAVVGDVQFSITFLDQATAEERDKRRADLPSGTRSLGPRRPGVIVRLGQSFRLTGVAPGPCVVNAIAMEATSKKFIGKPVEFPVQVAAGKTNSLTFELQGTELTGCEVVTIPVGTGSEHPGKDPVSDDPQADADDEGSDPPNAAVAESPPKDETKENDRDPSAKASQVVDSSRLLLVAKVVDAETGEPIKSFTALPGTSRINDRGVRWQWQPHLVTRFSDGKLSWPPGGKRGYRMDQALRIEAEGYLPSETPRLTQPSQNPRRNPNDAGEVLPPLSVEAGKPATITIRLKRDPGFQGVVVDADGKPVEGAVVAIEMGNHRSIRLRNGLSLFGSAKPNESLRDQWERPRHATTDAQGRFRLPTEIERAKIVASGAEGFASVSYSEFQKTGKLILYRWGRIEGQAIWNGKPASGEEICLFASHQFRKVTCDGEGRFVFDKIPAGRVRLGRNSVARDDESGFIVTNPNASLVVAAGGTTRCVFGGRGRPITGKVAGFKKWENVRVRVHLPLHWPSPSMRSRNDPTLSAFSAYLASPYYQHYQVEEVGVDQDGNFRLDRVPAARYAIVIQEQENGKRVGQGEGSFTVDLMPSGQSDQPQNVGTIEIGPDKRITSAAIPPMIMPLTEILLDKDAVPPELRGGGPSTSEPKRSGE